MRKKEHIVRSSAKEIELRIAGGESKTDWERVKSIPQTEVERLADEEEGPLPEGWEAGVEIGVPEPKEAVHIRLDKGVCDGLRRMALAIDQDQRRIEGIRHRQTARETLTECIRSASASIL